MGGILVRSPVCDRFCAVFSISVPFLCGDGLQQDVVDQYRYQLHL